MVEIAALLKYSGGAGHAILPRCRKFGRGPCRALGPHTWKRRSGRQLERLERLESRLERRALGNSASATCRLCRAALHLAGVVANTKGQGHKSQTYTLLRGGILNTYRCIINTVLPLFSRKVARTRTVEKAHYLFIIIVCREN